MIRPSSSLVLVRIDLNFLKLCEGNQSLVWQQSVLPIFGPDFQKKKKKKCEAACTTKVEESES